DRCLPKTAIETLEAIRLFLFTPQTAFVIATDEAMIEYAVRHHFPDLPASAGPTTYARNYLEKLTQVPFRIPALGVEEAKVYVTLLLAQAILSETSQGFADLVEKARAIIRTPWLSNALTLGDLTAADSKKQVELTAAYRLAQQLGASVAEGLEGNPRQIKRFLNAVTLRKAVADARGLSKEVELSILARIMLIERFRPEFYAHVAKQAMAAPGGTVQELKVLETSAAGSVGSGDGQSAKPDADAKELPPEVAEWASDEWLRNWARLDPERPLSALDLRPYVFATRDKKGIFARGSSNGTVDKILSAVSSGPLGTTQVDTDIRALGEPDAKLLFTTLADQILATDKLNGAPPQFGGLCALVRHHPRFQGQLVGFLSNLPTEDLGSWAAAGWNPQAFEEGPKARARELLQTWASKGNRQLHIVAKATLKTLSAQGSR
ncbi:KAP family P-loop NTPase fold protein, partial [Microvirga aerophila]